MPVVGTILQGWGSRILYLFDNDQGKKDGAKNLEKNWSVTVDEIESILDDKGGVEDLFSLSDFKKFVLNNENLTYTTKNSAYVKKSDKDKVLLSRLFLQGYNGVKLNNETEKNVKELFNKLEGYFK
jgi:hypothetical protein